MLRYATAFIIHANIFPYNSQADYRKVLFSVILQHFELYSSKKYKFKKKKNLLFW